MSDERVGAGYDAVATAYHAQFADELDHKPLERGLLDAFCGLSPKAMIADIGCGPGGHPVDMDGYFLDPSVVTADLVANGFRVQARLDREPIAGSEFASRRCYILARRTVRSSHGPRA